MTRTERAIQREARLKADLEKAKRERAQSEANDRARASAALDKRRYRVGALADEAGLFQWDNATLTGLFQVLARLQDLHDPVPVLEALLMTWQHTGELVVEDLVTESCASEATSAIGVSR
jgi:hypothetical protein